MTAAAAAPIRSLSRLLMDNVGSAERASTAAFLLLTPPFRSDLTGRIVFCVSGTDRHVSCPTAAGFRHFSTVPDTESLLFSACSVHGAGLRFHFCCWRSSFRQGTDGDCLGRRRKLRSDFPSGYSA